MYSLIVKEINKLADKKQAKISQSFFKTGVGEYGEGDVFLGLKMPVQRQIAKKYKDLKISEVEKLLQDKIHEYRTVALCILIEKFQKGDEKLKKQIVDLYLKNIAKYVNNWDLVDISAHKILGEYLLDKSRKKLYQLAKSKNLWEKRVSIVSTWIFIRNNQIEDTVGIAEILLHDTHDLIHKAVGWMLREAAKKDQKAIEEFLDKYHKEMPRTMLRYTIERFSEGKRKYYMKK